MKTIIFCLFLSGLINVCTYGQQQNDTIQWLKVSAFDLGNTDPDVPITGIPFEKILASVDLVLAGEATHGTKEFAQMKHRLFRQRADFCKRNYRSYTWPRLVRSQQFVYAFESTLNGNRRIELTSLNTRSMVNPTILNGRSRSQTMGKRNSMIRASGQQITSKINQSTRETKTFIVLFSTSLAKGAPTAEMRFARR